MRIAAEFTFEAAHQLAHLPEGHKCKRLHGHNYRLEVVVEGQVDERGFVMDYAELEAIVQPLVDKLDHRYLNEIAGLFCPTTECLVEWFLDGITRTLRHKLVTVRIYETPRYWAEDSRDNRA